MDQKEIKDAVLQKIKFYRSEELKQSINEKMFEIDEALKRHSNFAILFEGEKLHEKATFSSAKGGGKSFFSSRKSLIYATDHIPNTCIRKISKKID